MFNVPCQTPWPCIVIATGTSRTYLLLLWYALCFPFDVGNLETSLSTLSRASRQIHEPGPHALHLATLTHTLLHELRITSGLGLLCQTPTLLTSITLAWKFLLSSAPYDEGSWYWDAASHLAATWALILEGLGKMEWDPLARGVVRDLKGQGADMAGMYVRGRLVWAERQATMEEDEEMDVEIEVKDWETYEEELSNWAGVVRPISSESLTFILETISSRVEEFSRFDDLNNNHCISLPDLSDDSIVCFA
jgi:hypothetical protein